MSAASDLVAGDSDGSDDVFVKDLYTGALVRTSERDGVSANGASASPRVLADGRRVVYSSNATNLTDAANGLGHSNVLLWTGDEATAVSYDLKKKEGSFKQQTIVARVENVVVTLDYNGAGLAGDKSPSAADLLKDAKKAAKEAVAAVTASNKGEGADAGTSPSGSASKPASPSKSSSKSAKPSASAAKKS